MKKARYSFFSRQDAHFQYDLFPFKKFYIVHVLSEESARAVKRWTSAETQDSHLVVKHVILNTYQTLRVTALIMRKIAKAIHGFWMVVTQLANSSKYKS